MSEQSQPTALQTRESNREVLFLRTELQVSHTYLRGAAGRGWEIRFTSNIKEARELLQGSEICTGLVYVDSRNCAKIEAFITEFGDLEWVALTTDDELKDHRVQHLITHYIYDFHTQPVDIDRLLFTLGHAHGIANLRRGFAQTKIDSSAPMVQYHMVGTSPVMRMIFSKINKVAATELPVLITGKSGTGKELIATAIHDHSDRSDKPLMVINCGALVPSLVQSELFGHEKGSFTSADRRVIGRFEAASGGTIFLDEIGELPLELQSNLLRVLEEKVIQRVGASDNIAVDVRVIAATNCDLSEAVRKGLFREDLYYRLNVVDIHVPPLSERKDDIELLAKYFLNKLSDQVRTKARGFSLQALKEMKCYPWPGSVRQLINAVKRAMVLCEGRHILPEDLGLSFVANDGEDHYRPVESEDLTLKDIKDAAEYHALISALSKAGQNVTMAAEKLGISRVTLYKLLKKHDLGANN